MGEILERFKDKSKVSISDKKFALACKFHEFIFEPCYSDINSVFYGAGFHRFIANVLYMEFRSRGAGAEAIFQEFEELMRTKQGEKLETLFASSAHEENSPVLSQIREFAQCRTEDIERELEGLSGTGSGKWVLDLTNTALATLLANWGTSYPELTAICDPSKPIREDQSYFDAMIGHGKETLYSEVFGEKHPITFNLSGPIQFRDSRTTHGIQIADVIAAAAVYVFSATDDVPELSWRKIFAKTAVYGSVLPDPDELDLGGMRAQRNAILLMELHQRAKAGKSLIDGMPEYVSLVGRRLLQDRLLAAHPEIHAYPEA